MFAARAAFQALKGGSNSASVLSQYDKAVRESYVVADMRRTRNMRLAFKDGFYLGGFKAGLMTLSGGALFGGRIDMPEDAAHPKEPVPAGAQAFVPDNVLTFSKVDAVFKSGNATRDTIPSHLDRGQGRERGGGRVLQPRVSGGGLRAFGGWNPGGESAELCRLQGDRRAGSRAGRRGRAGADRSTA